MYDRKCVRDNIRGGYWKHFKGVFCLPRGKEETANYY